MKKRQIQFIAVSLIAALFTTACGSDSEPGTERDNASVEQSNNSAPISIPQFNRDSAFVFVEQQVNFGPRNPGSDGIEKTRDWLETKLRGYGANVIRQEFTANIYTGESYSSENIIGQFNPDNSRRVLLAAHYDTRFMGEEDTDPSMMSLPIPGADDGASGVGVLLEIARLIHENGIDLGVDIVFFDAEDQGQRGGGQNTVETWCLGSQYWARNPHVAGYSATFGILLDMVGSRNAFFNKENVGKLFRHSSQVHDL